MRLRQLSADLIDAEVNDVDVPHFRFYG